MSQLSDSDNEIERVEAEKIETKTNEVKKKRVMTEEKKQRLRDGKAKAKELGDLAKAEVKASKPKRVANEKTKEALAKGREVLKEKRTAKQVTKLETKLKEIKPVEKKPVEKKPIGLPKPLNIEEKPRLRYKIRFV